MNQLQSLKQNLESTNDVDAFMMEISSLADRHTNNSMAQLQIMEALTDAMFNFQDQFDIGSGKELSILAQRISKKLISSEQVNGRSNIEIGYRTALVTSVLAERVEKYNPTVASEMFLHCGAVTRNLHQNQSYPVQARGGLAPLLLKEANGHLIAGNTATAEQTIQDSLNWGLVEFEQILDDERINSSAIAQNVHAKVKAAKQQYLTKIRPGINSAMDAFQSFDFDFSLIDINNNRITKSHFDGKYLVVDLWGTWCAPCRAEIPHLNSLQKAFRSKKVQVVGIAIEHGESEEANRATLDQFLNDNKVDYQCLVGNEGLTKQLPNFTSYPTMLFIDREGKVRFATSGYLDYSQMEVIVEQLIKRDSMVSSKANLN
ncbi:MAG: TlpA disulfide reductase family protein [Pirellulaceae bacterium]